MSGIDEGVGSKEQAGVSGFSILEENCFESLLKRLRVPGSSSF
jgi:hypothetical protein